MKISESHIIRLLKNNFPLHIGDDTATLKNIGKHLKQVITKDLLAEDRHFRRSYFSPEDLARKALEVNLSDLAAVGARPLSVMLGIACCDSLASYTMDFLKHFIKCCKETHVEIIGGDTIGSSERLTISVTAIGMAAGDALISRETAKAEEFICVIGNIGDAGLGLNALESKREGLAPFKKAFLQPRAMLEEGIWLSEQRVISAMTDTSDGLLADLQKLCQPSSLGALIDMQHLSPSKTFLEACRILNLESECAVLSGGEDYGLMFTIDPACHAQLSSKFLRTFGYQIRTIGTTNTSNKLTFIKNDQDYHPTIKPFSHF